MTTIDSGSRKATHNSSSSRPNYLLRRIGVGLGLAATALAGVKVHDVYVDRTTTDPGSVTAVANTVPNPTIGGREMLQEMLLSANPAEAQAASHVDASELGSEIADAVYEATGEKSREISANYKVEVTIEPDGDVVEAQVIER